MKVKLDDIIFAIETTDQYTENFIDKKTGKVVYVSDMAMTMREKEVVYEKLDEHGFYRLPSSFDINDYGIMEDFIAKLPPRPQEFLESAIRGKGAFRRFKDGVRKIGLEQAWYEFQENAYRQQAIRWCKEEGIEYVD